MKHIPNILSGFRIVLIPFFVWQYNSGATKTAAILLLISGITDFLDGYLARRFGWVTQVGKVLDPAADKLTLIAVSIVLAINLRQYRAFFIIILLKDLIMLLIGGYLLKQDVKIEGARWFGKIATFVFYTVMIAIALLPGLPSGLVTVLLAVVTVLEVVAALMYIPDLRRYVRGEMG